jgi:uncharacterized protein (UPF0335 family)
MKKKNEDKVLNEPNDVKEFVERYTALEQELAELSESRKELIQEFSDKIDMKTLKAVMRVKKIVESVDNKNTYDEFYALLGDELWPQKHTI